MSMKRQSPIQHYTEQRPWGAFTQFVSNSPATVKIITVKPNQKLSLQYHALRTEFWHVLSGEGRITVGKRRFSAKQGREFTVAAKEVHRIEGGPQGLVLLEIATGVFKESDIVRLADSYGRLPGSAIAAKKGRR